MKASLHFQDSLPFFGYDRRKWLFPRREQFDPDVARQIQLSDGKRVELLTMHEDSQEPLCLVNVHTQAPLSRAALALMHFYRRKVSAISAMSYANAVYEMFRGSQQSVTRARDSKLGEAPKPCEYGCQGLGGASLK